MAIGFVCGLDASHKRESMKTRNPSHFMKERIDMQVLAHLGSVQPTPPSRLQSVTRIPFAEGSSAGLEEGVHA